MCWQSNFKEVYFVNTSVSIKYNKTLKVLLLLLYEIYSSWLVRSIAFGFISCYTCHSALSSSCICRDLSESLSSYTAKDDHYKIIFLKFVIFIHWTAAFDEAPDQADMLKPLLKDPPNKGLGVINWPFYKLQVLWTTQAHDKIILPLKGNNLCIYNSEIMSKLADPKVSVI